MCGIAGFIGVVPDADRHDVIKKMTDVITHRGPDDVGFYEDDRIEMGFRRLSIIDLGTGHQPLFNEDRSLVLTYNGEVYNYQSLKEELIACGHVFTTQTDSEVLLHGYEEWGPDMLSRLRGMWAFAIYDTRDHSLFLARDRFGIKPLHYVKVGRGGAQGAGATGDQECFAWASEIKSLLELPSYEKRFNYGALDNYLSFQYSVPPETFFKDIYCLMPGHYLIYRDGEVTIRRYWEARFEPDDSITEDEAVDRIEKVFSESVEAHRIADVEVGCFLSSGVDSSYVASYFSGQQTFTVGFDFGDKYNETSYAEALSKSIDTTQHSKLITSEEFWDAVPKVQYHLDQPLADPSAIALYFVSKLASEHVKVVLSGEGADELFGGYNIYEEPLARHRYQHAVPYPLRKGLASAAEHLPNMKGKQFLIRGAHTIEDTFIGNAFMYDLPEKRKILKDPTIATRPQDLCRSYYDRVADYDTESKMQYLDINLWMVGDILLKADRMSMANSLELRVPFLDREVFEVARHLPTSLRVNPEATKYAMRRAAARHVPQATADKRKLGFPVPTRVWLRDERYYRIVKDAFTSSTAQEFFNTDALVGFLDEHYAGHADNSRKIWTVYSFLIWYGLYFGDSSLRQVESMQ